MRVLVTGATGFIGYEVARLLAKRKLKPRLMVRRVDRGLLVRNLDAEIVQADLTSPASLQRAVDGIDAVIHLGARATFEEFHLLKPSIVLGSEALAEAAGKAGVKQFVFGSSLFVYDGQAEPIDGTTTPRPRLAYGKAKLEAEGRITVSAARFGMRAVSIRLPHVYGARDLFFSRVSRGRMIIPGRSNNLFAHLHVHDAARLLVNAAQSDAEGGWPVSDRRAATWSEFFDLVGMHYPRFSYVRMPESLARLSTRILRPFQRMVGRPTILTPDSVTGWNLNLEVKRGGLWDELGLEPDFPTIQEGVPAVLDECVAFRWLHPLDDTCG